MPDFDATPLSKQYATVGGTRMGYPETGEAIAVRLPTRSES